jgi:ribose transport system substrate-binding protein
LLFIAALFSASFASGKTWNVPALYWSMKIEGQVAMRKGFEEEVAEFNKKGGDKINVMPYVAGEGRAGILNQIFQFNEVLKKDPSAIVIQPTDNSALSLGLQEANRKKIPVIAYDQYIVNGDLTSYLTSDNMQAGRDNGEYIDSIFDRGYEIKIVVFEYPKVSSTIERVAGFFQALRGRGRAFKVLKRYEAVDPASGAIAAKKFLKDFPAKGSVDLILTVNDGGGVTIVKSLLRKKRTEILHATFDGDPQSIEHVKTKKITVVDSAQFCAELGRETARALIAYINKSFFVEKKLIPTFPVTAKNWRAFPGWMGRPIRLVGPPVKEVKLSPTRESEKTSRLIAKIGVAPLCPYLCERAPGVWSGYLYDILMSVSQGHNFVVEFESIPSSRLIASLRQHKVDYIILPANLVRYFDDIRIVGPKLGISHTGALVPPTFKDTLIDAESIKNKKLVYADLGSDQGVGGVPTNATKLSGFDAVDRMVNMIGDRRADIALGDFNVLRYSLARKPNASLQLLPTSLTGFNWLVLVTLDKKPEIEYLANYLEHWFTEARAHGDLERILDKYSLKDWRVFN